MRASTTLFVSALALCSMFQSQASSAQVPPWASKAFENQLFRYAHLQECAVYTAHTHNIHLEHLLAVLLVENGALNRKNKNNDGTYDYGVMQINTVRLGEIVHLNVTKQDLMDNDCVALFVGGYLIRAELDKVDDFWTGVGNYHYRIDGRWPHNHFRYRDIVYSAWMTLIQS